MAIRGRAQGGGLRAVLLAAAYIVSIDGAASARGETAGCAATEQREDRILAVEGRGELVLASGVRAVLAGVRWPDDAELARQVVDWLTTRSTEPIRVSTRRSADRWGRVAIDVASGDADLARGLVASGLVFVDAGDADIFCRVDLLADEAVPRARGVGAWTALMGATDAAGLSAREGEFAVVEGRVVSVSERKQRTYLNFARWGEPGLSVTVSKHTWRIMLQRGLAASTLKGRRVRVRGTIELWRSPVLDIVSADMIELLDGDTGSRR